MQVREIWPTYVASPICMKDTSDRRKRDVEKVWQEFAKAYWSRPANKITSDMIATWLCQRCRLCSPKTYNEYLRILRQVIGGILSKTGLACNPALEVPVKRNASVSRKPITKDQAARIVAVVEEGRIMIPYHYKTHGRVVTVDRPYTIPYNREVRDTILLGFWAGMRLSDALAVTADQYADGFITYTPRKTQETSGKEVTVPVLHDGLKQKLEELDGELTPNLRRMHESRPSDLCRLYRRIFEACGIETQTDRSVGRRSSIYGFHSLRHGFVTMMCNAGVDLNVCSEMVGHTSPITTRVYNHVSKARLLNEAAKIVVP